MVWDFLDRRHHFGHVGCGHVLIVGQIMTLVMFSEGVTPHAVDDKAFGYVWTVLPKHYSAGCDFVVARQHQHSSASEVRNP